ncbi:aminotransferase [Bdellovibrio bacteriovorus]|uniref:Aminotransferase n=1 Tax=Bdellovibrio bacteriovorus TaxID=959 RepID=A0A150WL33_BDEBC|nr:DegT/DnrJ/EryC1/StrS aminotransferase family protein [Bdellovibrio bacteriovorus]KYG64719.1 aminotransferase [Bdellovibrio bacteriovorus]
MVKNLAINGGDPVSKKAIAPWPVFGNDEIESVVDVLKSGKVNYWTGNLTKKFEDDFASYHGMKHGIALSNGTLALELALFGLGVGPGDEVITTCRTFIASASCIVRVGATPVMADIDLSSQNITADSISRVINKNTKAIVVVHLAGWPADMSAIMKLAKENNLKVIEDCAQSHGAKIDGRLTGSFGDMSAFSFCQDKIMTTGGEGGILLTNESEIYEKMWAFKDHGKSYDAVYRREHPPGFRWLHESFGTNWRFTEIQSAIALKQLEKLEAWVLQRRHLAHKVIANLKDEEGLIIPQPSSREFHSYYRLYAFIDQAQLRDGWNRDRIMHAIQAEGFPCFVGSCGEIYLEKAFVNSPFAVKERLPNAKKLSESSLAFLVHPTLADDYADGLSLAVKKVLKSARK